MTRLTLTKATLAILEVVIGGIDVESNQGLNWRRNRQDYDSTPKSLEEFCTVPGDGVTIPCDVVISYKRRTNSFSTVGSIKSYEDLFLTKSNLRLSSKLKSKEPTLQVVLDALKFTPFYKAFEITVDVPEIYMQEFWVTISRHHSSLRFKLNGKTGTVNVDNFRDMLKIYPKLPGQIFEEPPLGEEILSFIKVLGHTDEIKFLSDINVNHMHQPWRSFAAIINKCLSGKTIALESLRLSRAQIL
ncbi:hypothetical protein Tco_0031276 [Tanacetum coccineum]